ncbi:MAG TPA: SRPBCC family protein [Pirellulales bacterium]|nr:SRPBCC family protein [Pirellulales bacterium]
MTSSRFVYVTYIRTTPEKLWQALVEPEFTRQYWVECWQDCQWKVGSSWKLMIPDGRVADSGKVVEIDPPKRLVLSWRNEFRPELHEEGYSRATFEIEQLKESVKLTVTHEIDRPGSKLIGAVSNGWPMILASLKSLLETGSSLVETREWNFRQCATEKAAQG